MFFFSLSLFEAKFSKCQEKLFRRKIQFEREMEEFSWNMHFSNVKLIPSVFCFQFYFHDADNIGAEIIEIIRYKSRDSNLTNHIPRIGLYKFMRESGAVCFPVGEFPQSIPKSKLHNLFNFKTV